MKRKFSAAIVLILALIPAIAGCLDVPLSHSYADATTVDGISYCKKIGNDQESVAIGSRWDGALYLKEAKNG